MSKTIRQMFSKSWWFTTLLVFAGAALCVRLGIWQLDRLEQRRAFNAHVEAMWAAPVLEVTGEETGLTDMEYRSVVAAGAYDFDHQIALRNQYWNDQYGYHLVTPLVLSDGKAVLVDRGWIPADGNDMPDDWQKYDETAEKTVSGIIRLGQEKPDVGGRPDPTLEPGESSLSVWNNVNLVRLADQMPYELVGVYIQLDMDAGDTVPPIPYQPEIEITEGPHLGYAGQWFTFASILFFGYPFFLRKKEKQHE
ncbi:SURF1 family protein [bacterium]|nr:SURF1 family protein [bacterium]